MFLPLKLGSDSHLEDSGTKQVDIRAQREAALGQEPASWPLCSLPVPEMTAGPRKDGAGCLPAGSLHI